MSHPLEHQKIPICNAGCRLFSSLIFMLRRKGDLLNCFRQVLMTKSNLRKSHARVVSSRHCSRGQACMLSNACTPEGNLTPVRSLLPPLRYVFCSVMPLDAPKGRALLFASQMLLFVFNIFTDFILMSKFSFRFSGACITTTYRIRAQ